MQDTTILAITMSLLIVVLKPFLHFKMAMTFVGFRNGLDISKVPYLAFELDKNN